MSLVQELSLFPLRSKVRTVLWHYRKVVVIGAFNVISLPPHWPPGRVFKSALLRSAGLRCERTAYVNERLYVWDGRHVSIGGGARIGLNCQLFDYHEITIGRRALVSHNFTVIAGTHDVATLKHIPGPVRIGDDVWIGAGVTIVGPVTIGDGCVIGAGSVVLHNLPANTVCAGTPCRVIRPRNPAPGPS